MPDAIEQEIWIGLAEVVQRPGAGALMDRNQAFVNVLSLADGIECFAESVRSGLSELGFDLVLLEDAEPLRVRQLGAQVDQSLLKLADSARLTGYPQFGPFHTWTMEDDQRD